MAFTDEQQLQFDLEHLRGANHIVTQSKSLRLEAIRLAKETLLENARNKPVGESEVSAEDIVVFARKLTSHIEE